MISSFIDLRCFPETVTRVVHRSPSPKKVFRRCRPTARATRWAKGTVSLLCLTTPSCHRNSSVVIFSRMVRHPRYGPVLITCPCCCSNIYRCLYIHPYPRRFVRRPFVSGEWLVTLPIDQNLSSKLLLWLRVEAQKNKLCIVAAA